MPVTGNTMLNNLFDTFENRISNRNIAEIVCTMPEFEYLAYYDSKYKEWKPYMDISEEEFKKLIPLIRKEKLEKLKKYL
jgi:deoxyadenosine/deoxycytidine kinase